MGQGQSQVSTSSSAQEEKQSGVKLAPELEGKVLGAWTAPSSIELYFLTHAFP